MTEADVETVVQRAREKLPGHRPRVITDNAPSSSPATSKSSSASPA
jgi:hypothetical protein